MRDNMRPVSSICLPISGSSWYCLSLSESRKQRVRALTWLAFSWSTDRASIACKLVFVKLDDFLSTQRVDYWQLFLIVIALLKRSFFYDYHGGNKVYCLNEVTNHHSSRHSTQYTDEEKLSGEWNRILTWERNLLTRLDGWCGKEFPFLFFRNLNLSDIFNWNRNYSIHLVFSADTKGKYLNILLFARKFIYKRIHQKFILPNYCEWSLKMFALCLFVLASGTTTRNSQKLVSAQRGIFHWLKSSSRSGNFFE